MTKVGRRGARVGAIVILAALTGAMGGCGRPKEKVASAAAEELIETVGADPDVAASAAPPIDCDKLTSSVKGGLDVAGIKIGMTPDEVSQRVTCAGLSPASFAAGGNHSAASYEHVPPINGVLPIGRISADDGKTSIQVVFYGLPGQERAVGVQRILTFDPGSEPLLAQLKEQIAGKYGALEPLYRQQQRPGDDFIVVRLEKFVGEPGILGAVGSCVSQSYSIKGEKFGNSGPECGAMVTVRADTKDDNPELVSRLNVALTDGLYADGLRTTYMAAAREAEAQRKRDEVKQAEARKPVL